jgi:hypothetical protein
MSEELLDAPNQQVVRPDESAPWEEGEGGSAHEEAQPTDNPLDSMTKDELVSYANANGIEVTSTMTKAEIRKAIDEAGG